MLLIFKKIKKPLKRKNLKKNEIYFTIASSIILGLAAIYISFKANEIAEKQYQMDYFESRPEFLVKLEELGDGESSQVIIKKINGKAKNIRAGLPISVLDIQTIEKENLIYGKTFILGDNFREITNDFPEGNYEKKVRGYKNLMNSWLLKHELHTKVQEKYDLRSSSHITTFVSISYLNFEEKRITEYYLISQMSSFGTLVTDTIKMKNYVHDFFPDPQREDYIFLEDIKKIDIDRILNKYEKEKIKREVSHLFLENLFCK